MVSGRAKHQLVTIMRGVLKGWKRDFRAIIDSSEVLDDGDHGAVFTFVVGEGRQLRRTSFVGKHLHEPPREYVRLRGKVHANQHREMAIQARCAAAGIAVFPIALVHTNAKQKDGLLIMERLPAGTTVTTFVRRYRRDEGRMARVRGAIMRAVSTMHALGIMHGDLHGDNMWLCDEQEAGKDKVLVLDFARSVRLPPRIMNSVGKAMELCIMGDANKGKVTFELWADDSVRRALWVPSAANRDWQDAMWAVQDGHRAGFNKAPKSVRSVIDQFLDLHVRLLAQPTKAQEDRLLTMQVGTFDVTVVTRRCFATDSGT